jgi:hypothetical protein
VRLKITLEEVESGATEEVLAGMVVARHWEVAHSEPVAPALESRTPTVVVELAHLAYNRKHGKTLTIDEFEQRFEPVALDAGGEKPDEVPSDPATAPS